MINRFIEWSLRNRFLVLCALVLLMGWGVHAVYHTPVDAIPDLSENQVIVFTDWPGRGPQEVEDQITYPISENLQGLTGVKDIRAQSMFGFSFVTVIFQDEVDNYFARTRVVERLNYLGEKLPAGVVPKIGPDASGLGWVYQYYLAVDPTKAPHGGYDLAQLRSVQDWFIRYELNSVSGVAEVASIGGFVRQYQIEMAPGRMRALQVSLADVMAAVEQSSVNVGGKAVEENGREYVLRGVGLVKNITDLENLLIKNAGGTAIYLRDVADVQLGGDFRRGALDVNGQEVVGGTIVMRNDENALAVIGAIHKKIAAISNSLPPGVSIKPFYDRSRLIDRCITTLKKALGEEILLVILAHIIFLWHFRSILIVTLPLPASILISFILLKMFGVTSNLMSLSGIAIAIGVLVDAGIVMTENVIRHHERFEARSGNVPFSERFQITLKAAQQVGRPLFFAMLIIILAFVPVFALSGAEGRLFHPLAYAKTFAMIAATLISVSVVPVLCTLLVRGPFRREEENWVMRSAHAIYRPMLDWALSNRRKVFLAACVFLFLSVGLAIGLPRPWLQKLESWRLPGIAKAAGGIGSEFMPTLNEGSLLFMPVLLPSTSLTEIKRLVAWQDAAMKEIPEVVSAAGKLGRSETATDPAPVEMIETTIELKPESEWRPGLTQDALIGELTDKLKQAPGYVPGFLHPIEGRMLMLSTGVRAQIGLILLGDNLETLQAKALEAEKILRTVPGATGVAANRQQGKPYLNIELDRPAIARYGLRPQDVLESVEAGLGGKTLGFTLEGRQRVPVQVRFQKEVREDIDRMEDTPVFSNSGQVVPLGQVAHIKRVNGPAEIDSQNGRLRVYIQANVRGRDLGSFAAEAQRRISQELSLPTGITVQWSGEYENQKHAQRTLMVIIPVVLLVVFTLLYLVYRSFTEAAHVLLAIPFALTGGVLTQYFLGYPFSTAVWVGYIALFGTAISTAIVMVVYLEESVQRRRSELGRTLSNAEMVIAVRDGARLRLRPKLMTVCTIVASLLPIMWSHGTGAEIMRPLAAPVLGGMVSSFLHVMILTPIFYLATQRLKRSPI